MGGEGKKKEKSIRTLYVKRVLSRPLGAVENVCDFLSHTHTHFAIRLRNRFADIVCVNFKKKTKKTSRSMNSLNQISIDHIPLIFIIIYVFFLFFIFCNVT